VDTYLYTAWKDGRFVFRNRSLVDVMQELSRWYNFNVEFKDEHLKQTSFSIDVKRYDSFSKIKQILELTEQVKLTIIDNNLIVSD
jgi:ferric-dicitrate binding protein FerR (iron transport regulator)